MDLIVTQIPERIYVDSGVAVVTLRFKDDDARISDFDGFELRDTFAQIILTRDQAQALAEDILGDLGLVPVAARQTDPVPF